MKKISSTTSMPLWVKVLGIVVISLVLLFFILHLTGNSPGGPASHKPSTNVTEKKK